MAMLQIYRKFWHQILDSIARYFLSILSDCTIFKHWVDREVWPTCFRSTFIDQSRTKNYSILQLECIDPSSCWCRPWWCIESLFLSTFQALKLFLRNPSANFDFLYRINPVHIHSFRTLSASLLYHCWMLSLWSED